MTLFDSSVTSDKDYLEIHDDGQVLLDVDDTPDSEEQSPDITDPIPADYAGDTNISHNLGYVPIVRAFFDPDKNGTWYASRDIENLDDPWFRWYATTTKIKLMVLKTGSTLSNVPVFYRIYKFGDESITSDDRIDKIFLKGEDSGSVASSPSSFTVNSTLLTIPHNSGGDVPIFTVQFSEDEDDWYEEGTQIIGADDTTSGPPGGPYARFYFTTAQAYIDDTNLYINLRSNYASAKTIYVRYALDYRD